MKLVGHHKDRYFLFEIEWGNDGDPWAPYGRVYDRAAGVLFGPIPFRRLNEAEDFFEDWQGPIAEHCNSAQGSHAENTTVPCCPAARSQTESSQPSVSWVTWR